MSIHGLGTPPTSSPQGTDPQTKQQVEQAGEKLGMNPQQIEELMKLMEKLPPELRQKLLDALTKAASAEGGGQEGGGTPPGGGGSGGGGSPKSGGAGQKGGNPMEDLTKLLESLGVNPKDLGLDTKGKASGNEDQFPGSNPEGDDKPEASPPGQ